MLVIFVTAVIASAAFIGLATNNNSWAAAYHRSTSHQPEQYSELYFNTPGQLPTYSPTGKKQSISFHITNHEAQSTIYHFQIVISVSGQTTSTSSAIMLANDQGWDKIISFVIPTPNTAATIVVTLLGTPEQIIFRTTS